jgi:exodeoxyribonuclease VII large subunit
MQDKQNQLTDNLPEITVSELSNQVKFTVETAFDRVRVRGEISRPTKAASGHLYLTLKDEKSVLDGVCWKGNAQRLSIQPEEGMEVICTGKITTYPNRSKYQMVIEQLELAGEGALLKLLEERRKRLTQEGLFNADIKRSLPLFPSIIGVVTSPTGAVLRDILHRISDRFPMRVIIWPFNEEIVVRAVANSKIPLISAIGHETDTTLIDFAADVRAPTPTAAAELAVPVRSELLSRLMEIDGRLFNSINRILTSFEVKLDGISHRLGDPTSIIEPRVQNFDYLERRFFPSIQRLLEQKESRVAKIANKLTEPELQIEKIAGRLNILKERFENAGFRRVEEMKTNWNIISNKLHIKYITQRLVQSNIDLEQLTLRKEQKLMRYLEDIQVKLTSLGRLHEAGSFQRTLDRGFVLIRDQNDVPIFKSNTLTIGQLIKLQFQDGSSKARVIEGKQKPEKQKELSSNQQETLF